MLTTNFQYEGKNYELKLISSMVEADDQIENLLWSIFWLYLILVVAIIVINNLVLRKLWRPFYRLLHQLKTYRVEKGDKFPDIKTKTKEFVELKNAINTLINHTLEAFANQKQFTENAAHELQTPLAIATNKLELLLEKGDLGDGNAASIAEVLQIIERLTQLNKSLLLLSKIENKQFFKNQSLSINQIVHQSIEDLEEFATFKNVEVSLEELDAIEVEIDAMLANILISNLIKNAIFHNKPDGKVSISIEEETISICNTSTSGRLDEQRIFKRFYKKDADQQHTGLGLAIVKAICKLYNYSLSYHFDNQHCFEVRFGKK